MTERLLYERPGGVRVSMIAQPDGTVLFRTRHDTTPIIESNKRAFADADRLPARSRELRPIASIPHGLVMQWLNEAGISPAAFFRMPRREQVKFYKRKIFDPDYLFLRTSSLRS